jgi:nitroimidazol reductase NimA-like FMN-containing flavoprotein (pyridoxamine 5'-phosphate oxidase superfamily)
VPDEVDACCVASGVIERCSVARMSADEIIEFLAQPVICRLGCLDDTGWPYVVPVWVQYADGGFYVVPRERSVWAGYIERDGRVSLCLDERDQHKRVIVKGMASIIERPNIGGRWDPILREMAERYWGDRGIEYHTETLREPRWLIFVKPIEMTSWYGTWARRYRHYEWQVGAHE